MVTQFSRLAKFENYCNTKQLLFIIKDQIQSIINILFGSESIFNNFRGKKKKN